MPSVIIAKKESFHIIKTRNICGAINIKIGVAVRLGIVEDNFINEIGDITYALLKNTTSLR